ncbi:MAG: carboxymuconolactone decarboxylase family protein [Planctomycetota bacterium]
MPRLNPVDVDSQTGTTGDLIAAVKQSMGGVPNMLATMANSPAALAFFLKGGEALSLGSLSAGVKEQIAVAVGGANACEYCVSAHTMLGANHGVAKDELARNLEGDSSDPKIAAILTFARAVVRDRGFVSDEDLSTVRGAGVTDSEIAEVVATVALNIYTNYFNHIAQTTNDFPKVEVGQPIA